MVRDDQFTLKSLLLATAFIAVACALVRYVAAADEPADRFWAAIAIPLSLCGAAAVLRRRVTAGMVLCTAGMCGAIALSLNLFSLAGIAFMAAGATVVIGRPP